MPLPPLVVLPDQFAYEAHWIRNYVMPGFVTTHDGISVRFFRSNFAHAFFTETIRGSQRKDKFDMERAQRMDWIAAVLCDHHAELYRRAMPHRKLRRIALVTEERYAVITEVERGGKRAQFITAYVVNSDSALSKMRSNPTW